MKKSIIVLLAVAGLTAGVTSSLAESGAKEITLKGKGTCLKCALKESDSCQNVLVQEKNEKLTKFYLVQNEVSKKFHPEICTESKPITVVGVCKKVGDKFAVTPRRSLPNEGGVGVGRNRPPGASFRAGGSCFVFVTGSCETART